MHRTVSVRLLQNSLLVAIALASLPRSVARAQTSAPRDTLPHIPLFTPNDAYLGALFVVGTIALAPLDKSIAERLQNPNVQANQFFQNVATDVRVIAVPGSVLIGTSLYAIGRLGHWKNLADLGLHGEEAILVGNLLNTAIKDVAGRARPYVSSDTNPHDYQFMRGFHKGGDYQSFPSGHALAAFAAAAAVSNEASRWWPNSRWYVGTAMYGGATLVAMSRLYNNKHWASDVIMAAGVGTFAGNKVVRYHHRTNPHNRIDRWLLSVSVLPDGHGGLAVGYSLTPGDWRADEMR